MTNLEMEFIRRGTSQRPNSPSAANEHAPKEMEMEMEMVAGECRNGAPEAEPVSVNILLDRGKLGALKRREFFDNLLKRIEDDNLHFLQRQKERIDRRVLSAAGGLAQVLLYNISEYGMGYIMFFGLKSEKVKINILEGVSGIIKPCRLTLLLGPPGCGKSTLLRALAGKLDKSLKVQIVCEIRTTSAATGHVDGGGARHRTCHIYWCYQCGRALRIISYPSTDVFCSHCFGRFLHEIDASPRPAFPPPHFLPHPFHSQHHQFDGHARRWVIYDSDPSSIVLGRAFRQPAPSLSRTGNFMQKSIGNCIQVSGDISYNGYRLDEFVPEKTAAYISQYDLHIPEITVRETLDFSAQCQGVGNRAGNCSCSFREKPTDRIRFEASMPGWLSWGFWISPLTYAEISTAINEFLAPRWQKLILMKNGGKIIYSGPIGQQSCKVIEYFEQFPKWWIWLYYLAPTSWALNSLMTSQYRNIDKEFQAFGERKTVAVFLNEYFGFHQDRLGIAVAVITAFPIVLIALYCLSVEKMNFQKR
nr:unnamed protein product [Digitaria exilis]